MGVTGTSDDLAAAARLQVAEAGRVGEGRTNYGALDSIEADPVGCAGPALGGMPEDWVVKRLGELGQVVRGGSPRPAGDPRFFNGQFIPWLTVASLTNLPDSQIYVAETASGLTEEGAVRSRTLEAGTLIIANSGATLGVAKVLKIRCCANDGIAAIINQRYGDKEFLCHFINTRTTHLREVVATGNGQPNLNTALIREIQVPLPPAVEQRAIAEALSDVDGLLGALDALIAKKRAIKQATMQQLLTGKTRLPGFTEEWTRKRFGEIASVRNDKVMPADVQPDTLCLELEHIGQGHGQLTGSASASGSTASKYRFLAGDVLFGRLRPYLRKFWMADREGICSTEVWPITVNSEWLHPGFLFALVQSDPFIDAASVSYGTHMPRADWGVMRAIELCLPPVEEQAAIASVLAEMVAEIAALSARRDKTRAIKQGMTRQLLTGRVRLVSPSAATIDGAT